MGVNRASQNGGGDGDTEFLPLPNGRSFRFEVVAAEYRPSDREGYRDQISFVCQVAQQDRPRLEKLTPKLEPGQQQGDRAWANCGATCNGWKRDNYVPTALSVFIAALFGADNQQLVADWLKGGNLWEGADADDKATIDKGLEWFVGMQFIGTVKHPDKPAASGRIYPKIASPVPVGDREDDPEYQEFARGKFDLILGAVGQSLDGLTSAERGVAEGAALAPQYDEKGEPIGDEEAELERKLAEARAKKAGREPVGAGAGKSADYGSVFGDD